MKKGVFITILCIIAALVFAREPQDSLTIAFSSNDMTVDPLHAYRTDELQMATGIYEGLVSYHPSTLMPVPGVAYKWDVSEDGRVYTFYLRERAKFSNGDPVTATDFRDSWFRIIDPDEEGEYSFLFDVIKGAEDYRNGKNRSSDSVGITVNSRFELEVELERPASHFLSMLPHMSFAPVHRSYRETKGWEHRTGQAAEQRGAMRTPLISNGPFVLESWSASKMVLKRNKKYWDRWNVTLDTITILTNTSPAENADLLNDGVVQWADYAETGSLENTELMQVSAMFATSYLYFRAEAEPWNDPRVRKGLSLLIPWEQLRAEASSFFTNSLVPSVGFYEKPEGLVEAQVDTALELLQEAGYPNGRGLPEMRALATAGSVANAVLENAASIWEERIGADIEVAPLSFDEYQKTVNIGGYTIGSSTWIGDFADPLSFLQMWTTGSKLNDARYASDEYDSLIREAMAESSDERYGIYARAEELLLSGDVVVIPLSHPPSLNLVNLDSIYGWYSNALDIHPFKYIGFREPDVPDWYVLAPDISRGVSAHRRRPEHYAPLCFLKRRANPMPKAPITARTTNVPR